MTSDFRVMALPKVHRDLPDEEIMAHCWGPNAEFLGGTDKLGRKVVRIDDNTVVKFGCSVKRFEFENLKIAKSLVDPDIVHIPEAYRFFTDNEGKRDYWDDNGYILMEYIQGTNIDPIEDPELVQRIADIVAHFASIRGEIPGTLSRGPCSGILFPDCDEFTFTTTQAMEDFFNRRLFPHNPPKINLKGVELVLCHLDIAPRNILWKEDGSICFLDWASAGFYPRCFESAAQKYLLGFEKNFNQMLIDAIMPPLSEDEEAVALGVMVARGNSEKYTFRKPSRPPWQFDKQLKDGPRDSAQLGRGLSLNSLPDPCSLPPFPNSILDGHIDLDRVYYPPQTLSPPILATGVEVDHRPDPAPTWAYNNIGFHADELKSENRVP